MKIRQLQEEIFVNDANNLFIRTVNPKQILCDTLTIGLWKIEYSYTTERNNDKKGIKYMFYRETDYDIIDNEFMRLLNTKYISNVKILDVEYLGDLELDIEQ